MSRDVLYVRNTVSSIELIVVLWSREFKRAIDVVIALSIKWEYVPSTNRMNGKRMSLFAIFSKCTTENRGSVELMATEFRHESASGALENSPTDELFDRGSVTLSKLL